MSNKRRGEPSIPANHEKLMTPEQLDALRKLETFGWSLSVIRRPKFEPVEVLLVHNDHKSYALLTETGELDHQSSPKLRDDLVLPAAEAVTGDPWANVSDDMEFEVKDVPEAPKAPTINNEPVPTSRAGTVTKSNNKPPKNILV